MAKKNRVYIAIDLKSWYAFVECVERRLNPMIYGNPWSGNTVSNRTCYAGVST